MSPTPSQLPKFDSPSSDCAQVDVLALHRAEWVNGSWYAVHADGTALSNIPRDADGAKAEAAEATRAAVAELIEQQKRDAQLVPVLMSYLRDYLPPREMERMNRELLNRGLDNQDITRAAALARVGGAA